MDLLVYLIKKNEVNIYDIPIALITDQYLAYLEWMKAMNIDVAGEFLVMASTLAQIKSRMLLPIPDSDDNDGEDPRLQIARPLMEYLQSKSIAEQLNLRRFLGDDVFVRGADIKEFSSVEADEIIKVGLVELIEAFQKVLDHLTPDHQVDFEDERISITDRMAELIDILEIKGSITFDALFSYEADSLFPSQSGALPRSSKGDKIITFLAILEMAKLNLIRIAQYVQTGMIRLFYL